MILLIELPFMIKIWGNIYLIKNNIDLSKNIQCITSKQIKKCKKTWKGKDNQFEPRLLCSMNTSGKRPNIFKNNNMSLLAIKKWNIRFNKA